MSQVSNPNRTHEQSSIQVATTASGKSPIAELSGVSWKRNSKHRQAALRFGFGRFILQNIPVFGETAVLDPDNIRGDPGNRPAVS